MSVTVRLVGRVCPVVTARETPHVDPSFETGRRWVSDTPSIVVGAENEEMLLRLALNAVNAFSPLNKRSAIVGTCLFMLEGEAAAEAAEAILKSNPSVIIDLQP